MFPDMLLKADQCGKCLTALSTCTLKHLWVSLLTGYTVLEVDVKVTLLNKLSLAVSTRKVGSYGNKMFDLYKLLQLLYSCMYHIKHIASLNIFYKYKEKLLILVDRGYSYCIKSKETRMITYTCRYSSDYLIPNSS